MANELRIFMIGMGVAGFIIAMGFTVYWADHWADDMCSRVYGTSTREFAICVFEMEHKLRDKP